MANTTPKPLPVKNLLVPGIILLAFWGLALWGWLSNGFVQFLFLFGYIGTALGIGLGLYGVLPKSKKPIGRRLTLFLIGLFLILFAIFLGEENPQIEGFLFGLLTGVIQMAVMHYLVAKVFGPLLFGRLWCGWACWTVMVLDLLPFSRSPGRLPKKFGGLRYLHFAISAALVLVLVFAFGYKQGAAGQQAVIWFIAGNLFYYATGIILAYALKDNRAFCKYLCPVVVPLKLGAHLSLIKVAGSAGKCSDCGACVKTCPMDIRIPDYIHAGQRVLSTECILCQTCITACAQDALKLSVGFDMGGKELLRERAQP